MESILQQDLNNGSGQQQYQQQQIKDEHDQFQQQQQQQQEFKEEHDEQQQQQYQQHDDLEHNQNQYEDDYDHDQQQQQQNNMRYDYDQLNQNNDPSSNNQYQGQKRQASEESNAALKKRVKVAKVDLRILLPGKDAGAIIGRAGANIKKLRAEHKTIIQVPDTDGPERLLLIGGEMDAAIETILDIIPLLEDNQKYNKNMDYTTELRLLVHQSQAGCIIGRGGDKIKELRQRYNLDMKVYSECAPMSTERIAQMKGKPADIVNCLKEVLGLLESAPPKGQNRPYDPHNFNEFLASQYGGYLTDKRGTGSTGGGFGGGDNAGSNRGGFSGGFSGGRGGSGDRGGGGGFGGRDRGGGRGGDRGGRGGGGSDRGGRDRRGGSFGRGDRGNDRSGDRGGYRGGRQDNSNRGGQSSGGGGFSGQSSGGYSGGGSQYGGSSNSVSSLNQNQYGQPSASNAPVTTSQVTIPNELAGAIIGPRGTKIQQIREQSGAGITIDKPQPGSNDRIITITGTTETIQNAQYLLQMTVKQSGLWHN